MRVIADELEVRLKAREVLRGLNLVAEQGELTAVIGANGAGKTTLLRALAGLIPIAAGKALIDGRAIGKWPPAQLARLLAYLPQERTVNWALSARNIVALGRLPHQPLGARESAGDRQAIADAIAAMDIVALSDRPVSELSGGEKARVLLARALAQQPLILIADEPVAGLDPAHQLQLFAHLRAFVASGRTALLALHDLSLAARFCHKLVLLNAGRAIAAGAPAEVLTFAHLSAAYGIRAQYRTIDGVATVLPLDLLP